MNMRQHEGFKFDGYIRDNIILGNLVYAKMLYIYDKNAIMLMSSSNRVVHAKA